MIRSILLASAALAVTTAAAAQDIAITNAKVWTGTDAGTLDSATVIIMDGQITGVGVNLAPPSNMRTINADGKWLTPGIFAPFSRVGTVEVGAEDTTNDISAATSQFSVSLRAADGFNPAATTIDVTRVEGVTHMAVVPGNGMSLIAGQGFVTNTSGNAESIIDDDAFVFVDLGEGGAGLAGGSRPAAWAAIRGAINDARSYPGRYIGQSHGDELSRADAQAFGRAVRGQQLIMIAAHRASDIRQIISLKDSYPALDLVILGADEGWLVADELAAANIPVIVDPFSNLPASFAQLGATARNGERLIAAGVETAFGYLGDSGHQTRLVLQSAGNAVANGVAFDDAMAAITTVPARIFGVEGHGAITAGNAADFVIWDGDPLEVMSAPELVFIDGEVQSPETRQTKLRDRYLNLDESERPLAFKR